MELSEQYRLEGHKLYKLNRAGDAYVFVACTPKNIKTLAAARRWFERLDELR